MFNKLVKVKAGALQYVLVISVIIAIILMAFIMLIQLQEKIISKNRLYKETIYNVTNGFNYLSQKELAYNLEFRRQFSENKKEETTLVRKRWGIFDIAIVKSTINKESFQKVALMGWKQSDEKALYLKENNTPLVLVGKTQIRGDVFLPKQGVKSGSIAGNSFYGTQLIYGKQFISTSTLPKIQNIENIKLWKEEAFIGKDTQFFELEDEMKLMQSFTKPTLIYEHQGVIQLQNVELIGNIVVISNKKIQVKSSAKLKDVILIAPEIEILKNVQGNFQAYAIKNILVEKYCKLEYPTALILYNEKKEKDHKIEIKSYAEIKGILVYEMEKSKDVFYTPQIKLDEESSLSGELYCKGNVELLGNVKGTVYANNFIAKQFGSVYINYIYNGVISFNDLPLGYIGLGIGSKTQKVAKWLY